MRLRRRLLLPEWDGGKQDVKPFVLPFTSNTPGSDNQAEVNEQQRLVRTV